MVIGNCEHVQLFFQTLAHLNNSKNEIKETAEEGKKRCPSMEKGTAGTENMSQRTIAT